MPVVTLSPLHWAEGPTIDVLIRLLNKTLLNPSYSWLVVVSYAVQTVMRTRTRQLSFLEAARAAFWATPTLARSDPVFQGALALCAVGAALKFNRLLDRAARNNFAFDKRGWRWGGSDGTEVVLITGGESFRFSHSSEQYTIWTCLSDLNACLQARAVSEAMSPGVSQLATSRLLSSMSRLPLPTLVSCVPGVKAQHRTDSVRSSAKSVAYYKVELTNPEAIRDAADQVRREIGHP